MIDMLCISVILFEERWRKLYVRNISHVEGVRPYYRVILNFINFVVIFHPYNTTTGNALGIPCPPPVQTLLHGITCLA